MEYAGKSVDVLLEHVEQGLDEADQVHGHGDRVGEREHEPDGAAEFWACDGCKNKTFLAIFLFLLINIFWIQAFNFLSIIFIVNIKLNYAFRIAMIIVLP
jgi:hypothetical protein